MGQYYNQYIRFEALQISQSMKKALVAITLLIFSSNIILAQTKLVNGVWHASVKTASGKLIPFNFEVKGGAGKKQIAIINGNEHFEVPDVKTAGDSVFIHMPLFDSEFRAAFAGNNLKGYWIRHLPQKDLLLDFVAEPNASYRFFRSPEKASFNVDGRWSAIFASGDTT